MTLDSNGVFPPSASTWKQLESICLFSGQEFSMCSLRPCLVESIMSSKLRRRTWCTDRTAMRFSDLIFFWTLTWSHGLLRSTSVQVSVVTVHLIWQLKEISAMIHLIWFKLRSLIARRRAWTRSNTDPKEIQTVLAEDLQTQKIKVIKLRLHSRAKSKFHQRVLTTFLWTIIIQTHNWQQS